MMRASAFRRDERGVSTVVGAVLVAGVLFVALVMVRINHVPLWEEEREAAHMQTVTRQLIDLKSGLDQQADAAQGDSVSYPLSLSQTSFNVFLRPPLPHPLSFEPDVRSVELATGAGRILESDGVSHAGLGEDWVTASPVSGIASVESLRLRAQPATLTGTSYTLTLGILDAQSDPAGTLGLSRESSGRLLLSVQDGDGVTLQQTRLPAQENLSTFWVDALAPEHRFVHLLEAAAKPVALTFTASGGFGASYASSHHVSASGVAVPAGSGGLATSGITKTYAGGALQYQGQNLRHTAQDFTLESGALLLVQPDGMLMRSLPHVEAGSAGGIRTFSWTFSSLVGDGFSLAGPATVVLDASTQSRTSMAMLTTGFTLTIPTAHPELWADHLQNVLEATSMASTEYNVEVFPDHVLVEVIGPSAGADHDVHLVIKHAAVRISVRG